MGNSPSNKHQSHTPINIRLNSSAKKKCRSKLLFSTYVDHIRNTFQKPTCIDLSSNSSLIGYEAEIAVTCSSTITDEVAKERIEGIIEQINRIPEKSINLTLSYSALELFNKVVKVLPANIRSFKLMTLNNPQTLADFLSIPNSIEIVDFTRILLKENIYFIVEPLLKMNTLRVLKLGGNLIGEFGAMDVANIIRKTNSLNEIELWGNELNTNGMAKICEALMQNKSICKINIDSNNISDDAVYQICRCLNQMQLQHISLNSNSITSKGAIIFAHGIAKCSRLESLCLNTNKISNHGAAYLIKSIARSKLSLYIDLRFNCHITNLGALKIINSIKKHSPPFKCLINNQSISPFLIKEIELID